MENQNTEPVVDPFNNEQEQEPEPEEKEDSRRIKDEEGSEVSEHEQSNSNEGEQEEESVTESEGPKEPQLWPLEPQDGYSLTVASKQHALQSLQSKLTIEKGKMRSFTTLEQYDNSLYNLNFVEAQIFQEKLRKIKSEISSDIQKKIKKRKPAEEPSYIRIFKHYVDQIEIKLKQPLHN